MTEHPLVQPAAVGTRAEPESGGGPWRRGLRALLGNRRVLVSAAILVVIVVLCLLAPLYASYISGTDPFVANPVGTTVLDDGTVVPLLQPASQGVGVLPIGPTGQAHFLLGADGDGRDVAARILYGGRNTLVIGVLAGLVACAGGLVVGLIAGYVGGVVDGVLSRILDVVWAFPVLMLAISISAISFASGISLGFVRVSSGSLALPVLIIGVVYVPYVARPVRGAVLSVRAADYVGAATSYGAGHGRIIRREILPNVLSRVIVLLPLMVATAMLLESGLSFLGIGVHPPAASWGTIIEDGTQLLRNRPLMAIVPGALLALTVCVLNILGDAIRDAFDPKAELRMRAR
ncbi:ABC transporter permease [Amycolatopsis circi]|uniref:ABC transporter permease n=1 Tax=Amycolatopsis circi TaxID=871959 RepID=UPI000E2416B7|nr:ABC transporter permease [Amycolatopsis circi]